MISLLHSPSQFLSLVSSLLVPCEQHLYMSFIFSMAILQGFVFFALLGLCFHIPVAAASLVICGLHLHCAICVMT